MNNFNHVFIAVKKHCDETGVAGGQDIFEKVASEAGVPILKIDFILNTLQNLQLIKYSIEEHYIKLTAFGKKQERLFTDN